MNHHSAGVATSGHSGSLTSGSTTSVCLKHKHLAKSVNSTNQAATNGTDQGLSPALVANVVDCASCCERIQCYSSSSKGQALDKKSSSSTHHHTTKSQQANHQDANNNNLNKSANLTGSNNQITNPVNVSLSGSNSQQHQQLANKVSKSPSHHSSAGSSSTVTAVTNKAQRLSSSTSNSHHHHSSSKTSQPVISSNSFKQQILTDPASVPNLEQLKQEQALLKQHQKQKHQKTPSSSTSEPHSHRHSHQQQSASHHSSTSHSHHHHSHHSQANKSSVRNSPDSGKQSVSKEVIVDTTASGQHCHQPSSKMPLKGKENKEKTADQFDRKCFFSNSLCIDHSLPLKS